MGSSPILGIKGIKILKKEFLLLFILLIHSKVGLSLRDDKALHNEVRVENRLSKKVSLDLAFVDSDGKKVSLGDFVKNHKATILIPVYYGCPTLCTHTLNEVVYLIDKLPLNMGKDFGVLCFSINPLEKSLLAYQKSINYHKALKNKGSDRKGWQFWVGEQKEISKLTEELGFYYIKDGAEYAHASALYVLDNQGQICQYRVSIPYKVKDIKFALIDASQGRIGSFVDQIVMFCYSYNPISNEYEFMAWSIMRAGGALTLLFILCFLGYLIYSGRAKGLLKATK